MKCAFISLLFIWLYSIPTSGNEIFVSDIIEELTEEWIRTYIISLSSLCPSLLFSSGVGILQGNITVEPIFQRNESFCCLMINCFDVSFRTNNCSDRLQNLQFTSARQYLEYTICMNPYKYRDEKYATINPDIQDSKLFGHLTVASCPENASIHEHLLCENMTNEELQPVTDTIPVTANDVHFANRFCAACHGFKSNFIFWDLQIHCTNSSKELVLTRNSLITVIKERIDCFLIRVPPVQASKIPMCQLLIIRSCNVTGSWTNYNKKIQDLCLDLYIENEYIDRTGGNEVKYKNVFCAICNGISGIGIDDCIFPQEPPTFPIDFSQLIFFNTEKSLDTVEDTVCPLRHKFIPIANMCMMTYCSTPMLPEIVHNTCSSPSPVYSYTTISLEYAYKLRLDIAMTLSSRHELETAISEAFYEFNYEPYSLTFAYELAYVIQKCTNDVDGHFDVLYCHFEVITEGIKHQNALQLRNRLPSDRFISINGTAAKVQFLRYGTDPSFTAYGKARHSIEKIQCIHNPYSNTTLIMFSLDRYQTYKADRIYSITYMECPQSLIPLQQFHIERYEHGLRFLKTDAFVSFNDFKTFNSTHVFVCQKTLLAMQVVSLARKNTLDGYGVLIVLVLHVKLYNLYF